MSDESTWEKAYAQNGFSPEVIEDFPGLHVTMLHDHLVHLADERYGIGRWIERAPPLLEGFEPATRYRAHEATDEDDNPVLDEDGKPVMVTYYDDSVYFRMSSWFRAKGEGE